MFCIGLEREYLECCGWLCIHIVTLINEDA